MNEKTAQGLLEPLSSAPPPHRPRSNVKSLLQALLVIVLWGVSFSVTRTTVREVPPLTIAFLRFALATALFWPLVHRRYRQVRIAPEDRRDTFLLGFVGVTLYFACENTGLKYTTASHGALIIATTPLATELTDAFLHRRIPARGMLLGLLAALLGVFFIIGHSDGGGATLRGDLFVVGAVITWVWYTFLAHRLVSRYPNLLLTYLIMLTGALTLFPAALFELWRQPIPWPSAAAWAGIGFLGIFCSAIAFLLWNQAIPALGVSATNNLLYCIPLVGVLAGVIGLGEPLTIHIAVGGVLILGGVMVAGRAASSLQNKTGEGTPSGNDPI
jgi:drug/metabolite transporter (DMT)-like permease